jgi:hypothetical protein
MCTTTLDNACPLCDAIDALSAHSMREQRTAAYERLRELGWPTRKDDAFRYCNLKELANTTWHPAPKASADPSTMDALAIAGTGARLVFVNGRFDEAASSSLPDGVRLLGPMLGETELDRAADFKNDPFAQLATALVEDGVVIEVADGQTLPQPIHIVHVLAPSGSPIASTLRVLIRLGRGARACILETWAGNGPALVAPMTEVELAAGAHCDHARTDAVQTSRNLLLSDTAKAWSRPELEIYADDVKCTHGATTGEIDPGGLFYLRARGVPEDTARALLAWAFAAEVINEVPVASLRTHLARRILAQLPGAERLDEGVISL